MHGGKVFISKSKIQFESKSQQRNVFSFPINWCLSVSQRYNLKANHNTLRLSKELMDGVYQ